jgi:archaellum biogenesis ATPase FlaH
MNMNNLDETFEGIKSEVLAEIATEDRFAPLSLNELFQMDFPESKWVIEKLIPHQGITIVSGAPASFKTWLLLQMAIDIATGGSLLGQFHCEKYNVLIIDEENHLRLVKERLTLLGADGSLPIHLLSQKGFLTSKQDLIDRVLKICAEKEIDVIFIDSLVRVNEAEENDASAMSGVFRSIKQFCQNGKTVVVTHHERKEGAFKSSAQGRLRGSSDISAAVDAHISVMRDKEDKTKIVVEQAKLRTDKEMDSFEATLKENGGRMEFTYLGLHSEDASKKDLAKEVILSVLQEETAGLSVGEIKTRVKEGADVGDKSISNAIKELLKEGEIVERKGKGNAKIYSLLRYSENDLGVPDNLF